MKAINSFRSTPRVAGFTRDITERLPFPVGRGSPPQLVFFASFRYVQPTFRIHRALSGPSLHRQQTLPSPQ